MNPVPAFRMPRMQQASGSISAPAAKDTCSGSLTALPRRDQRSWDTHVFFKSAVILVADGHAVDAGVLPAPSNCGNDRRGSGSRWHTFSPVAYPRTRSPTFATVPQISWPITEG